METKDDLSVEKVNKGKSSVSGSSICSAFRSVYKEELKKGKIAAAAKVLNIITRGD